VDPGQDLAGSLRVTLHLGDVADAAAGQGRVGLVTIGEEPGASLHCPADGGSELLRRLIADDRQERGAGLRGAAPLHHHRHQRLVRGSPAPLASGATPSHERLVGLHRAPEQLAGTTREAAAKLVQHHPGRLVAAQAEVPLKLEGRDPAWRAKKIAGTTAQGPVP
jgi:hypothetical protein